ncbi:D(1A) dopamine receptor [Rhinatrema bivittatum]|uniref:D(1A) dopamine receptor n=1 Tax=Rhinatrema bivittatum TaxID=194408 RepID=UPI00112E9D7A|nr:D(1A) dopamine receptor [Rhinatrema bivittatum]XP_029439381.1 D(1A) dopamine receptor [Rhinatrema bivittatum]XP_029439382.1 D(1A) dopamine receptor [Rhinatrema bivittatum]
MTLNGSTMDGVGPLMDRDSSFRVLTGCFLSLLILSTLLGNTLVCAAVIRFRHLRSKVTNFFVISLAVSDLLVAVLVMPWKAVAEIAGFWPFGPFCNIWVAFDIMCSTASILNLCVISVDRYWAISSPFRYERKMTPRVAFVMVSVAWTLSVLISFIPVQLNWHKAKTTSFLDLNASFQGSTMDNCDSSLNRTYAISSSLISFYIPVAIMIVTYTRIYRIAAKQIRRISALERAAVHAKNCQTTTGNGNSMDLQQPESSFKMSFKRETKVLKTLSVIMGVFVCCWLPFFILNCMVPFCDSGLTSSGAEVFCISSTTFDVFVWFGWANSSLNPIIYAFNADFRKAFSTLLGCYRFCPTSHNAIETVSFNNNGAVVFSSHHEPQGSSPKECNLVYLIPHAIICPEEDLLKKEEEGGVSKSLEKMSPALSGILDYEVDVSLEKINPITHNGQHKT